MQVAQFGHKCLPHFRIALFQNLRANRKVQSSRSVTPTPRAHLRKQRHRLNSWFGKVVGCLLLVRGVGAGRRQPPVNELFEPVGGDVGGNAFQRVVQQLAIVAKVPEYDVADDD